MIISAWEKRGQVRGEGSNGLVFGGEVVYLRDRETETCKFSWDAKKKSSQYPLRKGCERWCSWNSACLPSAKARVSASTWPGLWRLWTRAGWITVSTRWGRSWKATGTTCSVL